MSSLPNRLTALSRRVRQRLVSEACRRCYRDTARDTMPTAMLVGTGRSGTTWLAEIVDSEIPCRVVFEPFNPEQVEEFRSFQYFQYMPPGEENAPLLSYCTSLVCGEVRGAWVDSHLSRVFPRLRLIKAIRPTLMLRWMHERFPQVPILYVLRHPCAVVLSRMRLGWATDGDVRRFLCQPRLVSDHLLPYLDVIEGARTEEEKHAVVWCLSNLVPLRQFAPGGWTLLYYETLREHPEVEIPRVFRALGSACSSRVFDALRRPSRTTRHARGNRSAASTIVRWKHDLTPAQIDRVLAIVAAFGLHEIYGDSAMPLVNDPLEPRSIPGAAFGSGGAPPDLNRWAPFSHLPVE